MTKEKNPFAALHDLVESMPGRNVLVAGDIMLDRYIYGDASRISPESPVPVLSIREETAMLGGAGNVLANLTGLGVETSVLAVAAQDDAGKDLRGLLAEKGAELSGLVAEPGRPTTVKTRFLASNQQLLRADAERTDAVSLATEKEILARAEKLLPKAQAVILSDYGKGVLTPKLIAGLIAAAKKRKIPVLVDPKKTDYAVYKGASVVTPNRKELSEATGGMPTKTDDEVVAAARVLMKKSGIRAVVATRSQDGMTIVDGAAPPIHLRTEALEVFDVSGAGDTVIATIAAVLAAGADLTEAAAVANVAAGLVVAKVGTAPVRRAELISALDRRDLDLRPRNGASAVVDRAREAMICAGWDEARETVQRWKARGLKVGFTNGCFDILHPGHVSYLNAARDRCDRLVVALNADELVRRLKGAGRPVNDERARASVLAGLGAVDMVVLFGSEPAEDDKPVRLLGQLKPAIYFKGGDYTEDRLPEAPVVRAYGGEVAIMPLAEGHSTTATIRKMKDKDKAA